MSKTMPPNKAIDPTVLYFSFCKSLIKRARCGWREGMREARERGGDLRTITVTLTPTAVLFVTA